ncbi:MAG: hypothetical protein AAGA94_00060 [Pseudomonadota bacterium]
MKTNTRFINSIITTATETEAVMPWTRGKRRADFIAKRAASTKAVRKTG